MSKSGMQHFVPRRVSASTQLAAALRALIAAAKTVDSRSDRDIYTDAPECEDHVDELKDALEHLQTTARLAAQVLAEVRS